MVRGLTRTSLGNACHVLTFSPWTVAPLPTRLPSPQRLCMWVVLAPERRVAV